jgi:methyl-accepting chemotaxis protein
MLKNLSIGRKLYGAFAAVSVVFVVALGATLVLGSSARSAWRETLTWDKAVKASQLQIEGTRQQLAAQALYVATFLPKFKAEWEAGVTKSDTGTKGVQAIGDPGIAKIAAAANTADHHHDATVHGLLFPAVAAGDHKAAVAALIKANHYVRIPLAAQVKIGQRIEQLRKKSVARAESLQQQGEVTGIVLAIVALILASVLAVIIARAIRRPITKLKDAAATAASGDLRVDVTTDSKDELGSMANSFQTMIDNVGGIIGQVSGHAGTVSAASQQMASTSQEAGRAVGEIANAVGEVATGAERQVHVVNEAVTASEDMLVAAESSAANAKETAAAAEQARTISIEGMEAVEKATEAMRAVSESTIAVTEAMQSLGSKSEEIGSIVETITGIAGQTNLLALNAAIEAARAGEQGRGFAVVAEEVRKLAEESQRAAASIAELIEAIQSETQRTVSIVDDGARRTEDGVGVVAEARAAFEQISGAVADMNDRVGQIAASVDTILASSRKMQTDLGEVVSVAEESSASAEEVSASTQQTSASTQQIAASAEELARTAEELERLVGRFTTSN